MLLELRQLSQSLRTANVAVGERDDHLEAYSNAKPVFRVDITASGEVKCVSLFSSEKVPSLLKYKVSSGGLQESIPGFNVPPLFKAKESETEAVTESLKQFAKRLKRPPKDDGPAARRTALEALLGHCEPDWSGKSKAIAKCLATATKVVLDHLDKAPEGEQKAVAPLKELMRRAQLLNPELLRSQLVGIVQQSLSEAPPGSNDLVDLLKLLTRRRKAKAGNDPDAIQIMLELADWTDTPANHPSVWMSVNRVLVAVSVSAQPTSTLGPLTQQLDAFGEPGPLSQAKMPQVKLPALGTVILRSHTKAKPCQARYGMIEGKSFPVGQRTPAPLAGALRWLTNPELEGKTFRDISDSCGFSRKALLLAYPDPLPKHPPGLATILAKTEQQSPTSPDVRFIAAAELVVGQLKDLVQKSSGTRINVFVLAKGKKPPTKLLLSRQFSAERVIGAVCEWKLAAANIPPVFVRLFDANRQPLWNRCDNVPFPTEVARCLNRVWQRGGERVETVAAFDFGSALTLLLGDGGILVEEVAGQALRLAVSQWVPLLLAIGQVAGLGRVREFSQDERSLPVILGLLLFKLNHRKEVYMKAIPYWLGRLMAVADKLHRNYCDRERDGQIPKGPLLGNAAMSACLENPQAGLAELAQRIAPYQRVAGVELSTEVAEIVRHIDADQLPNRTTDEQKAQMLLGYLARPDLLPATTPSQGDTP